VFAAIGRFSYRHRRSVLAIWVTAFAVAAVASTQLHKELKGGGFADTKSPSQIAATQIQAKLKMGVSNVSVVFTSATLDARDAEFQSLEAAALARMTRANLPDLVAVETATSTGDSSLVSRDYHAALAVLVFSVPMAQVQGEMPHIRTLLTPTALTTYFTGEPALYSEMETVSQHDLRVAEAYTLPVALLVLLLIFGSATAAALPVVTGGMAVTVTLGSLWALAHTANFSIFVMNTATLLGLAVGIDYALLMVGRFREELAAGEPVARAVETTVARAGRSIFFSGLAVIVGLCGLISYPYMSLRSMGIGGALVVLFSVTSALTLLPALLGLLGQRVNSLRIFYRPGRQGRFWRRWSDWVMAHPIRVLAGTIVVVLLIAWPVVRMTLEIPSEASMPQGSEARRGYEILRAQFDPSALSPVEVLLTWPGESSPLAAGVVQRVYDFGQQLKAMPGARDVQSVVTLPGMTSLQAATRFWTLIDHPRAGGYSATTPFPLLLLTGVFGEEMRRSVELLRSVTTTSGAVLYRVIPASPPTSTAAQNLAHDIQQRPAPPGMTLYVGGVSAGLRDYLHGLFSRFPWIVGFVLLVTYLVLMLLLRSVLLPLKAVVVNLLSLLASYGALVWVFQFGHLEWLFHFKSSGGVDADIPILLFCTAFGVSMDYEVFLLSRMREAWLESGDNQWSVGFGLTSTGRIVTSAALIVAVVGASFTLTSVIITKALGVGIAVAVLLDATMIRILMVPAAMRLLGDWCWWAPAWLERRLPHIGE
jgi:RND superfamily putative drug exporter